MIAVFRATYLNDYKIRLVFNNGRSGDLDLGKLIMDDHRSIFNQRKDMNIFRNFRVEFDTLVWPNELDIAPEYLYFATFKEDPDLKKQFEEWGCIHQ
ncbi:MAG: DUF2442 domain-containing protein [Pseudomonadota bacterium]